MAKTTIETLSKMQDFLKARRVAVSGHERLELAELCEAARSIGAEVDSDGLIDILRISGRQTLAFLVD